MPNGLDQLMHQWGEQNERLRKSLTGMAESTKALHSEDLTVDEKNGHGQRIAYFLGEVWPAQKAMRDAEDRIAEIAHAALNDRNLML